MATTTDTPASQLAEAIEHLLGGVMDSVTRSGDTLTITAGGLDFMVHISMGLDPGPVDPLAHIKEGDNLDRDELRDPGDTRCRKSYSAEHLDRCSRKAGHPGQHIAWNNGDGGTVHKVWPNESAPAAPAVPGADPLAHIRSGGQLGPDEWPSGDRDKRCGEWNAEKGTCTREKDHPGQHIATFSDGSVLDVWPNASAPAAPAPAAPTHSPGMYSVQKGDRPDPTNGGAGVRPKCYESSPVGSWVCTRERGHAGHHVAGDGDEVLEVWS